MICKKCESRINSGTKCFQCGYDNAESLTDSDTPAKRRRSIPLIVFMLLFIAQNVFLIVLSSLVLFAALEAPLLAILAAVLITAAIFDMALCILILMFKRWAFQVYIALNVITAVIRLISMFDIFFIAFRGLLLFAIFKNDYKHFGDNLTGEPVSVKLARKKRQKENKSE